jgi:hypothetical protein
MCRASPGPGPGRAPPEPALAAHMAHQGPAAGMDGEVGQGAIQPVADAARRFLGITVGLVDGISHLRDAQILVSRRAERCRAFADNRRGYDAQFSRVGEPGVERLEVPGVQLPDRIWHPEAVQAEEQRLDAGAGELGRNQLAGVREPLVRGRSLNGGCSTPRRSWQRMNDIAARRNGRCRGDCQGCSAASLFASNGGERVLTVVGGSDVRSDYRPSA